MSEAPDHNGNQASEDTQAYEPEPAYGNEPVHHDSPDMDPGALPYQSWHRDTESYVPPSSPWYLRAARKIPWIVGGVLGLLAGCRGFGPDVPSNVLRESPWPSSIDVESGCPVDRFGYADEDCAELFYRQSSSVQERLEGRSVRYEDTSFLSAAPLDRPERYSPVDRRSSSVSVSDDGLGLGL